MQLSRFAVSGLFGMYDHVVPIATSSEDSNDAAVVIVHGHNGVGKTTVLRMIAGMMKLDFDVFRAVPFTDAELSFNSGDSLRVEKLEDAGLRVYFRGLNVTLHPEHAGARVDKDAIKVAVFRESFFEAIQSLTFEFLATNRLPVPSRSDLERAMYERRLMGLEPATPDTRQTLAEKVRDFVRNAQLDSPAFFRSSDPDLFQRIVDDLTAPASTSARKVEDIREQLEAVLRLEGIQERFGLRTDSWDFEKLMKHLESNDERALTVLGTYAEFLLVRAESRQFVADRLMTFEQVIGTFLKDKKVVVDARSGLKITSVTGASLKEEQLSSGEYQLLYLLVAALTTRRRGTIIAIDEPELSMHISWQRRLVPSLIRCASRAAPQLLLATHSPDIAAGHRENLVRIGTFEENDEATT